MNLAEFADVALVHSHARTFNPAEEQNDVSAQRRRSERTASLGARSVA
jgi:hypothetical protein